MNIIWSHEAVEDLVSLSDDITEDSPAAARNVVLRILHDIEHVLPGNPHLGRPGRVPGTRERVVPRTSYIVPYRLQRDSIQILRAYHGARRWPDRF